MTSERHSGPGLVVVDFEAHREQCQRCRPWTICPEGSRILQRAVDAMNSVDGKTKRGQT